jgi:predicted dehydrogenase
MRTQIQRIRGCEIVGVCDSEPLMAQQLCERFRVRRYFGDVKSLLNDTHPHVVHIATPPASHFEIARMCLGEGAHVYVEKPFTLHERDARRLIALADEKCLKLTVGHDDQFSHVARRMRELVGEGLLGEGPVVGRFLVGDFHMKAGMKYLIEAFYRAIVDGASVPISYREILLTARIMESIFGQLDEAGRQALGDASGPSKLKAC